MKIILNKDVKNLGEEGDVCDVKDGYARNFLLPKKLGVPYNRLHINNFKAKAQAIAIRKEQKRQESLGLKERLEKELAVDISMPSGDSGRLFGAVTNATIAEQLAHAGLNIDRKRIEVPGRTIKTIGNYVVKIRLYDEQVASLKVAIHSLVVAESVSEPSPEESGEGEEGEGVEEVNAESGAEISAETPPKATGDAGAEMLPTGTPTAEMAVEPGETQI